MVIEQVKTKQIILENRFVVNLSDFASGCVSYVLQSISIPNPRYSCESSAVPATMSVAKMMPLKGT